MQPWFTLSVSTCILMVFSTSHFMLNNFMAAPGGTDFETVLSGKGTTTRQSLCRSETPHEQRLNQVKEPRESQSF